ncbi:PucR family transcriptional regulator [Ornithinimicrobium cavernae]|uniref:PucR family transcriptional regulator n=1 Tax=Ornithinimicrobium cavernae TaxID=2666047 RepID=UPI000D69E8EA|nr:helix-turn-helix domain-containing protein [Ornithinimicrobium cavernae]
MTDLGAVLRLPGWRDAVTLDAGPAATCGAVSDVSLVQGHPEEFGGTPGTLYLVLEADLAVWRWDGVIRAAADVSAAAVIVPAAAHLERPSQLLAARLRLSVYRLSPGHAALPALAIEALSLLALPQVHGAELASRFAAIALTGAGEPTDLMTAAGKLAGVPVWAWLPGRSGPLTTEKMEGIEVPLSAPVADERIRTVRVNDGSGVQLATQMDAGIATVGLAPLRHGTLEEVEVAPLLRGLALALRAGQAQQLLAEESAARAARDLLDEVLAAGSETTPALEQRAEQAGFPLAGWLVGFAVALRADAPQVAAAARLGEAVKASGLHGVVVPRAGHLAGWLGVSRQPNEATRASLARRLRLAIEGVDSSPEVALGIGRPARGVDGLRLTLDEAREALDVAASRAAGSRSVTIDALGISATVRSWTSAPGFRATARSRLLPILGEPDLVHTLRVHLDQSINVTATAQVIGVHRNTVMTRIARVEALLGTTLADPEERLALQLAVRAIEPSS